MKVTEMRHGPGKKREDSIVSSEALFQITRIIVRRSKFIKGKEGPKEFESSQLRGIKLQTARDKTPLSPTLRPLL